VVKDTADGAERESGVSREEIAKARAKAKGDADPSPSLEQVEESERQLKDRQTTKGFLAQMVQEDKLKKKRAICPEYPPVWDDDWRPVAYFSQSINQPVATEDDTDNHRAEWWATECEALGLHNAIMHWAMYLRNGKPFSVVVDHQALLYLVKGQGRLTNRKILNMLMNLQEFRFSVIYRDGLRHLDADAVSRLLHYQDNGETHMLEMNGTSLPVTPDIPIALMRKILLDYEFCRPGDHRNTDPTYYFHPPLKTPGNSAPETQAEHLSVPALSTTVDDGRVGENYARASGHSSQIRPALFVSDTRAQWRSLWTAPPPATAARRPTQDCP
jgi:hypothetical protein